MLGVLRIDRFYLGMSRLGVFKLLTIGGVGLWWFYDIVTSASRTKKYNLHRLELVASVNDDSN